MSRLTLSLIIFTSLFGIIYALLLKSVVKRNLVTQNAILFWFALALILFVMAIEPGPMIALTHWLGFEVPANGIFFLAIGILMYLNLLQSLEISKLKNKLIHLIQDYAIEHKQS